jgi:hypothetical protein
MDACGEGFTEWLELAGEGKDFNWEGWAWVPGIGENLLRANASNCAPPNPWGAIHGTLDISSDIESGKCQAQFWDDR